MAAGAPTVNIAYDAGAVGALDKARAYLQL